MFIETQGGIVSAADIVTAHTRSKAHCVEATLRDGSTVNLPFKDAEELAERLAPVIPAQSGFELLTVPGFEFLPDGEEILIDRQPILGWRLNAAEAEPTPIVLWHPCGAL